jgi:hypothetical protein
MEGDDGKLEAEPGDDQDDAGQEGQAVDPGTRCLRRDHGE